MIILVCIAGFLGAMVDAIVGGGGLITIPALLTTGIPTHFVLGTNKFASSMGTISSSYHYYKSGEVDFKLLKWLLPLSLVGSGLGVLAILSLDSDFLKGFVIFMVIIIGLYTFFRKDLGLYHKPQIFTKKRMMYGMMLALTLGFYDGFFGPGTGAFIIFGLIALFGHDFKKASANAKFMNFTSNFTALVLFFIHGKINFTLGIPMAISMILGARLGAVLAVKNGSKFIKPVFLLVSLVLVIKMSYEWLGGLNG
jgi:hypothetical protein